MFTTALSFARFSSQGERIHFPSTLITKIASVGGVISNGNYTYLIKLNEEQLSEIIKNLAALCRSRKVKINSINNVEMGMFHNISTTQKEGGASIFVIDLEQFIKV